LVSISDIRYIGCIKNRYRYDKNICIDIAFASITGYNLKVCLGELRGRGPLSFKKSDIMACQGCRVYSLWKEEKNRNSYGLPVSVKKVALTFKKLDIMTCREVYSFLKNLNLWIDWWRKKVGLTKSSSKLIFLTLGITSQFHRLKYYSRQNMQD
jgi:hypothetical protein